jgi:myo-inositol-1(or 4)-monophosphatase
MDRRCEEVITGRISERFPQHDIVAEESHRVLTGSPFKWYVDPLDGTTNYVHGYPCFGVSIGLAAEGEIVLGVVRDPMREETFSGIHGRGAYLNGNRISVSKTRDLNYSLVGTGFPYDLRENPENVIDSFAGVIMASQGVRRDGSAALNLCYVAAGRLDGFWERKLQPWDLAAGILLVREAGGTVTGFDGGSFGLDSGEVLASNGLIHEEMIRTLKRGSTREEV